MSRDRAVVDDAAAARILLLHHAERRLRAQERAREVDVDDRRPLLVRQILDGNPGALSPALLNSTSSRPNSCFTGEQRVHRIRLADIRRDRSIRPPPLAIAAVFSSSESRRPASATEYPAACSASADARPMPLPAPVTSANRPFINSV